MEDIYHNLCASHQGENHGKQHKTVAKHDGKIYNIGAFRTNGGYYEYYHRRLWKSWLCPDGAACKRKS